MIEIELEENFISKSVTLTISKRKDISFTLNHKQDKSCSSTGLSKIRILLIELIIKLIETLIHKDLDHLIEISSLV